MTLRLQIKSEEEFAAAHEDGGGSSGPGRRGSGQRGCSAVHEGLERMDHKEFSCGTLDVMKTQIRVQRFKSSAARSCRHDMIRSEIRSHSSELSEHSDTHF